MSEDYKNKHETEEDLTDEWDSLAQDMNWLEDQLQKAMKRLKKKLRNISKPTLPV